MKRFIIQSLRKLLRPVLLPIFEEVIKKEVKNLRRMRQLNALKESVNFIDKNIPKHQFINNRLALISFALDRLKFNSHQKGIICEFGVFKGESINHIANIVNDEVVYGFDTFFGGLKETFIEWSSPKGAFKLDNLPEVKKNVHLIEGYFDKSLPSFLEEVKEDFKFVHIDCDLYGSTKEIFNIAKERFKPGTIIVFDDWFNYPGWQHEESKAFFEFIEESGMQFEYLAYSVASIAIELKKENA